MRPLLLGHRGARRGARENTLAAFELALAQGCDGVEFDVRRTSDGHAVICHDARLHGLNIADCRYDQIPRRGGLLCRLGDVLRLYAARAFLDIELKESGLEEVVVAAIREHLPRRYLISSFLPEVITSLHTRDSTIPLGLICGSRDQLQRWADLPVTWVMLSRNLAARESIRLLHEANIRAGVWTVNSAREMLRLAEWGADAIISDATVVLSRTLSAFRLGPAG